MGAARAGCDIAIGRYADLIGVAGEPLADIAVLQSVTVVMKAAR
jgi:imidazolonepropionase-like amidohydrolase